MERIFQSTPLLLLNPYIFFIYPIDIYTLTEQSIRYSNPNQKYRYLQLGQHAKGVKKTGYWNYKCDNVQTIYLDNAVLIMVLHYSTV